MVGFWVDMMSDRFLVGDPSWSGLWGVEPLGLNGCGVLGMERNRNGRRMKSSLRIYQCNYNLWEDTIMQRVI